MYTQGKEKGGQRENRLKKKDNKWRVVAGREGTGGDIGKIMIYSQ